VDPTFHESKSKALLKLCMKLLILSVTPRRQDLDF